MKIAVISAHYMPEIGYQEVHLARACSRLGHEVKVFTSAASVDMGGSLGKISYKPGIFRDEKSGFEILRLKAISYKSKAFSFALKKEVEGFDPAITIILGVAKGFPAPLLKKEFSSRSKLVSLYGDAKEYLERNSVGQKVKALQHEIGFKLVKEPLYSKAVRYCHKIILNIPESDVYFKSFLKRSDLELYEKKKLLLNLGYDPEIYFFDQNIRIKKRAELNVREEEIVFITSTRINRRKNLEKIISKIDELNQQGEKVRYILVGFLKDDYERELKKIISNTKNPDAFICFPFLPAEEIRDLYCAADAGIWLKVSISIQEAMGTGLPIILEQRDSVSHLLSEGQTGWYYGKNELELCLDKVTNELSRKKKDRAAVSKRNAGFLSYDSIAKKIIDSVNEL